MPDTRKLEAIFEALQRESREAARSEPPTLREWVDLATAWRIVEALRRHGGNRSAAARSLGIGRRTLYTKMERLGIHPVWTASGDSAAEHSDETPDPLTPSH